MNVEDILVNLRWVEHHFVKYPNESLVRLDEILKEHPLLVKALTYRGSIKEALGNLPGAFEDLELAKNIDPCNVMLLHTISAIAVKNDKYTLSKECLELCKKILGLEFHAVHDTSTVLDEIIKMRKLLGGKDV